MENVAVGDVVYEVEPAWSLHQARRFLTLLGVQRANEATLRTLYRAAKASALAKAGCTLRVIMELGGMLSHGAVVAREYGLPAVVNIEGATRRLADGQLVTIDGQHGVVWLK